MSMEEKRTSVPKLFGSHVFNDDVMQERLPKDVYRSLRKTIDEGKDLDLTVAPTTPTGSSPSTASPPRSTTALSPPPATAGSSCSSPARS